MHWTKTTPTEPGYYWWRPDISYHAQPVLVSEGSRLDMIGWAGYQRHANVQGGEWYGPLQEPGGDAIENCKPLTTSAR